MSKRKQLLSIDEAVEAKSQHRKPCSDCPFARASLPGWLGGLTVDEWLADLHHPGEVMIDCHTRRVAQCAGSAIYRANICKRPRPGSPVLVLPADKELVFSSPIELKAHHERG